MHVGDIEIRERQDMRIAWSRVSAELRWMVRHCRQASSVLRAIQTEAMLAFNQAARSHCNWEACSASAIDVGRRYVENRCSPTAGKSPVA